MKALLREPAIITALIQEALIAAVAFGVELTPEQMAAVLGVSTALLALVVRALVTPNAKAAE